MTNKKDFANFKVDLVRDGKYTSSRHVQAMQNGAPVSQALISYHKIEPHAIEHQPIMPKVPPPEELACMHKVLNDILGLYR